MPLPGRVERFRHFAANGFDDTEGEAFDPQGHGSKTGALIAATAPHCRIYSGAVIEEGNVVARILRGLEWMLDCPVRVVCLPFGVPGPAPIFSSLLKALRSRKILPIASIGNGGQGRYLSPGNDPHVLSVGAASDV